MKKLTALAIALSFLSTAAFAADVAPAVSTKYIFDAAHTQVFFSTEHMGVSHPMGRFMKIEGGYDFNPAAVEASTVNVTIDANSLEMNSEAWNKHMKSADFFNTEKFPTITFKSTKIEKTGDKTGKLTGDLTLLGVTKPVVLDVTYNGEGQNPMNKNMLTGFNAVAKIKRSDFGMNYGIPMVGDEATITINVEGIRQDFTAVDKK